MIICDIGWMTNYRGLKGTGDSLVNGGKYVTEHGRGHEVCNFLKCGDGFVYGHVESWDGKRDTSLAVKKLGARADALSVNGITVIWTALSPERRKRVVGWFRNATVFADRQRHATVPSEQHRRDHVDTYRIRARARDFVLLPEDERVLRLKTNTRGWPGRKPWWFAPGNHPTPELKEFLDRVDQLVMKTDARKKIDTREAVNEGGWGPLTPDPERNAAVEKRAIKIVTDWYKTKRKQIPQHFREEC